MKKIIFSIFLIILLISAFSLNSVFAKNNNDKDNNDTRAYKDNEIPEREGIYRVWNHPELRVEVFIYNVKGRPNPAPALICGLDDLDSLAVVDSAGWKLPSKWTYYLNSSSVPSSVGGKNLITIAANSFKAWTDVASLTITNIGNTNISQRKLDGRNIIAWGSAPSSALGVTYIWYNSNTKQVVDVDTIMNKNFVWMWSGSLSTCAYSNSYDAQDILTHELGHWLGLDDHYTSAYAENTMYGFGSKTETKKDTLTTGDINGVKAIY